MANSTYWNKGGDADAVLQWEPDGANQEIGARLIWSQFNKTESVAAIEAVSTDIQGLHEYVQQAKFFAVYQNRLQPRELYVAQLAFRRNHFTQTLLPDGEYNIEQSGSSIRFAIDPQNSVRDRWLVTTQIIYAVIIGLVGWRLAKVFLNERVGARSIKKLLHNHGWELFCYAWNLVTILDSVYEQRYGFSPGDEFDPTKITSFDSHSMALIIDSRKHIKRVAYVSIGNIGGSGSTQSTPAPSTKVFTPHIMSPQTVLPTHLQFCSACSSIAR